MTFDRVTNTLDKKKLADHVAATDGIWFNKLLVRSLIDTAHKVKLGGPDGPGTD